MPKIGTFMKNSLIQTTVQRCVLTVSFPMDLQLTVINPIGKETGTSVHSLVNNQIQLTNKNFD